MKEFHIATEDGKNAKVGITRAKTNRTKIELFTATGEETYTERIYKGTPETTTSSNAIIEKDDEIDFKNLGYILENGTRAYFKPSEAKVAGGFKVIDVITNPDGTEKERKEHTQRKANVNDTIPVKISKRFPLKQALETFAFCNHYALFHDDGLKYEYLYNIAKSLHDKGEVAFLGAGSKGNLPMIFTEGGSPYRGFLYGQVDGDKYRLLILLSKQEIKMPNRVKADIPEKPQKATEIKEKPKTDIIDI